MQEENTQEFFNIYDEYEKFCKCADLFVEKMKEHAKKRLELDRKRKEKESEDI